MDSGYAYTKYQCRQTQVLGECSVDTLVLILGTSPYKDQNEKNGPFLVLIMEFWSLFLKKIVTNGKIY